jgi:maleate cis-trans isomerase
MTAATLSATGRSRGILATPLARIGLIIPSSNRLSEPQLRHFAPPELGIHTTRLQMTGKWNRKLSDLGDDLARAASSLADAKVDLIVFHCTGTSMEEGPDADANALAQITRHTGIAALSTAGAVVEGLRALAITKLVLLSPYVQQTNDHERDYLAALGFTVLNDVALGLKGGDEYITVPPERWIEIAHTAMRPQADGLFLSCTNTSQIETIETLERDLGLPVVSSNQAVLWAAMRRLSGKLVGARPAPGLGRLMTVGE